MCQEPCKGSGWHWEMRRGDGTHAAVLGRRSVTTPTPSPEMSLSVENQCLLTLRWPATLVSAVCSLPDAVAPLASEVFEPVKTWLYLIRASTRRAIKFGR